MRNPSDTIGNRNRVFFPTCSTVPQSTTPPPTLAVAMVGNIFNTARLLGFICRPVFKILFFSKLVSYLLTLGGKKEPTQLGACIIGVLRLWV